MPSLERLRNSNHLCTRRRYNGTSEESDSDGDLCSLASTPSTSSISDNDKFSLLEAAASQRQRQIDTRLPAPKEGLSLVSAAAPSRNRSVAEVTSNETGNAQGKVLVCGVGYVGEELVTAFSRAYDTLAFDVSEARCQQLRTQYDGNDNVTVSCDQNDVATFSFDVALISVPTLLLEDSRTVDDTHISKAVELVSHHARPGSLVIVESSVTVGMTRRLLGHMRAKGIFVGFSPERVDPGRISPRFEDIPKVISGIDEESLEQVRRYYSRVFTTVVPVPTLETAEFTKLYENCQRLMLIHYANELADACESHDVDVFEVCKASATKPFGFTPFTPSLGAGGSCIPINPFYLLTNCEMPLLRHAAEANRERPLVKARKIAKMAEEAALGAAALATRQPGPARVLIYGLGFKKGNTSLVCAPAVIMAEELTRAGLDVTYYDAVVRCDRWPRIDDDTFTSRDFDGRFDVVVISHSPEEDHQHFLSAMQESKVVYFSR